MAHFAQLGDDNVVLQVIVVHNNECLDENGNESEAVGIAFCQSLFPGTHWRQTSYNGNMRGMYAGVGYTYDPINDVFVVPSETVIDVSEPVVTLTAAPVLDVIAPSAEPVVTLTAAPVLDVIAPSAEPVVTLTLTAASAFDVVSPSADIVIDLFETVEISSSTATPV
jgi:hypothetical protein